MEAKEYPSPTEVLESSRAGRRARTSRSQGFARGSANLPNTEPGRASHGSSCGLSGSCGPASWLINHVLGIRPVTPGCGKVEVRPFLGDLDWAEGAMALPDGRAVKVRAEKRPDGTLDVKIDAPAGIEIVR